MPVTFLIVEDNASVRKLLREWLGLAFPECRVLAAGSGEEGVALAEAAAPQVVVMDISLPGMNGIEATRCIKAALPGVKIIMLTVHEAEAYRADAAAAGASAYIPKRKMQTELIPALKGLLLGGNNTCTISGAR
jgi:DNA-binding NarL/FixJ family response regulator